MVESVTSQLRMALGIFWLVTELAHLDDAAGTVKGGGHGCDHVHVAVAIAEVIVVAVGGLFLVFFFILLLPLIMTILKSGGIWKIPSRVFQQ